MHGLKELLDAVVAFPEADAPRLAYAASVASSDPARAELIELQLRFDQIKKANERSDELGDLAMRIGQLVRDRGRYWAEDIAPLTNKWRFVRGFVEDVVMDAATFLRTAPDLYRRAPILHLQLTGVRPVMHAVLSTPHLLRLRSLDLFRCDIGDDGLALLASRDLPNLRWLGLQFNNIGRAGLDALCASQSLSRLAYVALQDNVVPDPLPGIVDDYTTDTALALELRAQHGPVRWLDVMGFRDWPPERDAIP
jgi:hypothetical protein